MHKLPKIKILGPVMALWASKALRSFAGRVVAKSDTRDDASISYRARLAFA